jgi:hypothetical protein
MTQDKYQTLEDAAMPEDRQKALEALYGEVMDRGCLSVGQWYVEHGEAIRAALLTPAVDAEKIRDALRKISGMVVSDGHRCDCQDATCKVCTPFETIYTELSRIPQNPVKGDGWMPIESAPKDGTAVLMWVSADSPHPMAEGFATARWTGFKWWIDTNGTDVTPLFWQPLPTPPVGEPLDDGGR